MPPTADATLAAGSGLASAATWGTGDFVGGIATRRASVFRILLVSQLVGLALLTALAVALRAPLPPPADLAWGAAAGLAGAVGIGALYAALAAGRMGVAAPITAVVALILPVAVGIASAGAPDVLAIVGFPLALAGIWLLARGEGPADRRAVGLALLSGAGFGAFFVLVAFATTEDYVWPLVVARIASSFAVALIVFARRDERTRGAFPWWLAAGAGACDAFGNAFFVAAADLGRLDVAAVLSSLYPAATVLLARVVLKEKLRAGQIVGLALTFCAILLIAWP